MWLAVAVAVVVVLVVVGFTSFIMVAPCSAPSPLRQARVGQLRWRWRLVFHGVFRACLCVLASLLCDCHRRALTQGRHERGAHSLRAFCFFFGSVGAFFFGRWSGCFFYVSVCIIGNWVTGFVSR